MRTFFPKLLIFFTCSTLLMGCLKSFDTSIEDWNPDFHAPVFKTSILLQDLLDNFDSGGLVSTDSENLIWVIYEGKTISTKPNKPLDVDTISFPILDTIQDLPAAFPSPIRYDKLTLKECKLIYTAASPFLEDVNVTLTLDDLKNGNTPLQLTFTIPATLDPLNPTIYADSLIVDGYDLGFSNGDFSSVYTAVTAVTGMRVKLPPMLLHITPAQYSYGEGYFGRDTTALDTGHVVIDFFKNWTQGSVLLEQPKVTFNMSNTYGIPIRLESDSLKFYTHKNGIMFLQNTDINDGFDLNYPDINQIGQPKTSVLELNSTNSNIAQILEGIPYRFEFGANVVNNADNDSTLQNYFTDNMNLDVQIDVEVPMHGSAQGFYFTDSFDVDFTNLDEVERVGFKLIADNGFPVDAHMQAYFLDINNQVIDSVFVEDMPIVFNAADINTDGKVIEKKTTESVAYIEESRFSEIKSRAVKVELRTTFDTVNDGTIPVKLFSTYDVDVRMGIVVGL